MRASNSNLYNANFLRQNFMLESLSVTNRVNTKIKAMTVRRMTTSNSIGSNSHSNGINDNNSSTWTTSDTTTQDQFMQKDTVLVLNEDDVIIGSASKKDSHIFSNDQPRGILHRAFSVFLFNEKFELLLQQRASSKITFPNVWTNTCCSHPLHGMELDEKDLPENVAKGEVMGVKRAAVRKLQHELGICPEEVPLEKFVFLTRLHYWAADTVTHGEDSPWGEHEIDYVLFIQVPQESLTINPHPDEVDAVEWVSKEQLNRLLHDNLAEIGNIQAKSLWSPWFRLICHKWVLPQWWDCLKEDTLLKCQDWNTIHRFDPPSEHMGGGGNAKEWLGPLKIDNLDGSHKGNITRHHTFDHSLLRAISLGLTACAILASIPFFNGSLNDNRILSLVLEKTTNILPALAYHQVVALTLAALLFDIMYVWKLHDTLIQMKMNIPLIPSEIPILGNIPSFLREVPWDLMERWHNEYGPIYTYTLLGRRCVAVAKPDHLKQILQSQIANVQKDVKFAYKPFLPILGSGIVTSEGKDWMRQRLAVSSMLRIDVLEEIPRITYGAIDRLSSKLNESIGLEIDLAEELRHLTLQVISETFFSLSAEESNTTFATMYLPIVEEGNERVWHPYRSLGFMFPFWWKHQWNVRKLNRYVEGLIEKRYSNFYAPTQGIKHEDDRKTDVLDHILSRYLTFHKTDILDKRGIRQLRDELKTFMLAGHETSAAMMTWAIYELLQKHNSNLLQQLLAPEENLEFSEACLREALRKYSVVPTVTRCAVKDIVLENEITIPKGATIMINIQTVHHDERIWGKDASLRYDPLRFLNVQDKEIDISRYGENTPGSISPYTFLPFIDGPRNCLGQHLALLESKIVLSELMRSYNFELAVPIDFSTDPRHKYMVPVIPADGLKVIVNKR